MCEDALKDFKSDTLKITDWRAYIHFSQDWLSLKACTMPKRLIKYDVFDKI